MRGEGKKFHFDKNFNFFSEGFFMRFLELPDPMKRLKIHEKFTLGSSPNHLQGKKPNRTILTGQEEVELQKEVTFS
jgi:hypothetical protein